MRRFDYIKDEYREICHYDLAMALLSDGFTDDMADLVEMCTAYFNQENNKDVEAAFNDFYCIDYIHMSSL